MNVRWMLPVFSVALVACSGPTAPADGSVTGQWQGTVSSADIVSDGFRMTLTQNGAAVTGTFETGSGGQRYTRFGPIDGRFEGGRVTLTANGQGAFGGRGFALVGELNGGRLQGSLIFTSAGGTSATGAWSANRAPFTPAP